jgi:hypothetical protein
MRFRTTLLPRSRVEHWRYKIKGDTAGEFTSYLGRFLTVVRAGYEKGEAVLKVSAEGLGEIEKVFNAVLTAPIF